MPAQGPEGVDLLLGGFVRELSAHLDLPAPLTWHEIDDSQTIHGGNRFLVGPK